MKNKRYRISDGKFASKKFQNIKNATSISISLLLIIYPLISITTTTHANNAMISPEGESVTHYNYLPTPTLTPTPTPSQIDKTSLLISSAIDEFMPEKNNQYSVSYMKQRRSEASMIMHCLLHRESVHGYNYGQGDNGKAWGILQYWHETWGRARREMIKQGLTSSVDSSNNEEEAIRTTVWVLWNQSRLPRSERVISILEWGPIYREYTNYKYSKKPGCQVPSWLNEGR